jgi:hypothetical protein
MAERARDTPWRQGALLPRDAAEALGFLPENPDPAVAIVVSHDCDLVQPPDVEPMVEVIPGCHIPKPDGNYTHCKNPRRLHLPVKNDAGAGWIELDVRAKRVVKKHDLSSYQPDASRHLTADGKSVLQRWLAARYRRAAFPDEFNDRLSRTGLAARLAKIMSNTGAPIAAVYFDLDNGQEVARTRTDDPYELVIVLLYSTRVDPDTAAAATETTKTRIEQAFRKLCYDTDLGQWQHIELIDCLVVSDQALTVAQAEMLKRWNADYISLRANDTHVIVQD